MYRTPLSSPRPAMGLAVTSDPVPIRVERIKLEPEPGVFDEPETIIIESFRVPPAPENWQFSKRKEGCCHVNWEDGYFGKKCEAMSNLVCSGCGQFFCKPHKKDHFCVYFSIAPRWKSLPEEGYCMAAINKYVEGQLVSKHACYTKTHIVCLFCNKYRCTSCRCRACCPLQVQDTKKTYLNDSWKVETVVRELKRSKSPNPQEKKLKGIKKINK